MMRTWPMVLAGLIVLSSAPAAVQDYRDVIYARQGQFYVIEYNLKILESMGANHIPYDRDVATKRAQNIDTIMNMHQDVNWLPKTATGDVPRTTVHGLNGNRDDFVKGWRAMMAASKALLEVAVDGPPMTLTAAAADMRATCSSCHQFYRPAYGAEKQ